MNEWEWERERNMQILANKKKPRKRNLIKILRKGHMAIALEIE